MALPRSFVAVACLFSAAAVAEDTLRHPREEPEAFLWAANATALQVLLNDTYTPRYWWTDAFPKLSQDVQDHYSALLSDPQRPVTVLSPSRDALRKASRSQHVALRLLGAILSGSVMPEKARLLLDLHIISGAVDLPQVADGTPLQHQAVSTDVSAHRRQGDVVRGLNDLRYDVKYNASFNYQVSNGYVIEVDEILGASLVFAFPTMQKFLRSSDQQAYRQLVNHAATYGTAPTLYGMSITLAFADSEEYTPDEVLDRIRGNAGKFAGRILEAHTLHMAFNGKLGVATLSDLIDAADPSTGWVQYSIGGIRVVLRKQGDAITVNGIRARSTELTFTPDSAMLVIARPLVDLTNSYYAGPLPETTLTAGERLSAAAEKDPSLKGALAAISSAVPVPTQSASLNPIRLFSNQTFAASPRPAPSAGLKYVAYALLGIGVLGAVGFLFGLWEGDVVVEDGSGHVMRARRRRATQHGFNPMQLTGIRAPSARDATAGPDDFDDVRQVDEHSIDFALASGMSPGSDDGSGGNGARRRSRGRTASDLRRRSMRNLLTGGDSAPTSPSLRPQGSQRHIQFTPTRSSPHAPPPIRAHPASPNSPMAGRASMVGRQAPMSPPMSPGVAAGSMSPLNAMASKSFRRLLSRTSNQVPGAPSSPNATDPRRPRSNSRAGTSV